MRIDTRGQNKNCAGKNTFPRLSTHSVFEQRRTTGGRMCGNLKPSRHRGHAPHPIPSAGGYRTALPSKKNYTVGGDGHYLVL